MMYKSMKIGSEQSKNRLNDFFQVYTCVMIPGLCAIVFVRTLMQIWYYRPYENIFEDIFPFNFCVEILVLLSAILVTQIFGSRAGNVEYSLTVNIYIILQFMFSLLLLGQWIIIFGQYQ